MQNNERHHRTAGLVLGGAIAALAGAALFNRYKARQAEVDSPPSGRFIEVDGVRLHYVVRGEGRPVLLLHGNGAMIQDMDASGILPGAAEHYRVIAFDRPGFGYSERPRSTLWTASAQSELLHKALEQLGIRRPIVVAHSWATLVALALALDHPDDVAALVLLSGYYFPTARADAVLFSPPAMPILGDVMRHTISPLLGRALTPATKKQLFAPSPVTESFDRFPVEMALRPSQIRALAADTALMVPSAAQLSRRYGELKLPVVIVAGDGDRVADFGRQSARLHATLPQSTLVRIPRAGHMVHHIAPDRVLAAIDEAARRAAAS